MQYEVEEDIVVPSAKRIKRARSGQTSAAMAVEDLAEPLHHLPAAVGGQQFHTNTAGRRRHVVLQATHDIPSDSEVSEDVHADDGEEEDDFDEDGDGDETSQAENGMAVDAQGRNAHSRAGNRGFSSRNDDGAHDAASISSSTSATTIGQREEDKDSKRMELNSAKKVKERARRGKMSESVRSLRILVPGCHDEKKVNQSQVLANTVAYISKLQTQLSSLQKEHEKLKVQLAETHLPEEAVGYGLSGIATLSQDSGVSGASGRGVSKVASSSRPSARAARAKVNPSLTKTKITATAPTSHTYNASTMFASTPTAASSSSSSQGGQPSPTTAVSSPSNTLTSGMPSSASHSPGGAGHSPNDGTSFSVTPSIFDIAVGPMHVPFGSSNNSSSLGFTSPFGQRSTKDAQQTQQSQQNGAGHSFPRFVPHPLLNNPSDSNYTSTETYTFGATPTDSTVFRPASDMMIQSRLTQMQSEALPYGSSQNFMMMDDGNDGMYMDDIEDVGTWPLYNPVSTGAEFGEPDVSQAMQPPDSQHASHAHHLRIQSSPFFKEDATMGQEGMDASQQLASSEPVSICHPHEAASPMDSSRLHQNVTTHFGFPSESPNMLSLSNPFASAFPKSFSPSGSTLPTFTASPFFAEIPHTPLSFGHSQSVNLDNTASEGTGTKCKPDMCDCGALPV